MPDNTILHSSKVDDAAVVADAELTARENVKDDSMDSLPENTDSLQNANALPEVSFSDNDTPPDIPSLDSAAAPAENPTEIPAEAPATIESQTDTSNNVEQKPENNDNETRFEVNNENDTINDTKSNEKVNTEISSSEYELGQNNETEQDPVSSFPTESAPSLPDDVPQIPFAAGEVFEVPEQPNAAFATEPLVVTNTGESEPQDHIDTGNETEEIQGQPELEYHQNSEDTVEPIESNQNGQTDNEQNANNANADVSQENSDSIDTSSAINESETPSSEGNGNQTDDSLNNMPENEIAEIGQDLSDFDRGDLTTKSGLDTSLDTAGVLPEEIGTFDNNPDISQNDIPQADQGIEGNNTGEKNESNNNDVSPHDNTVASVIDNLQGVSDQSLADIYKDSSALAPDGTEYSQQEFLQDVGDTLDACQDALENGETNTEVGTDALESFQDQVDAAISNNDLEIMNNDMDIDNNDLDPMEIENSGQGTDIDTDDDDDSYNDVDFGVGFD